MPILADTDAAQNYAQQEAEMCGCFSRRPSEMQWIASNLESLLLITAFLPALMVKRRKSTICAIVMKILRSVNLPKRKAALFTK
ncbi:hypothetical protein CEXT_420251 [Caerostris extrusa]|uniref:Uncharacterized protein n=1 Tax=Caerostris extrusa TaxID=172846 RepID=A0AAV4TDU8_CAEEX|nr:hypothetical protein CEXT_420251 [Caerostris extrusa]